MSAPFSVRELLESNPQAKAHDSGDDAGSLPELPVLPGADFSAAVAIEAALSALTPADRLRWAWTRFGARAVIGTSFQPAGIATLHIAGTHGFALPAFTLDTGLLFPETIELKARLERHLGRTIESIFPTQTVEQQAAEFGPELWKREPDFCCQLRKVLPLHDRLMSVDCWITGVRRDQSNGRATAPIAEVFTVPNTERRLWKLNVLADWSRDQVWSYLREHQLPHNILHDRGYRSIGCWPCTRLTGAHEDERAGRWTGFDKTECGIHTSGSGI
ncbi:MAG TPA: phosphoadenylyl-sulfate reductase [Opitutus sp.]|nr:phosphoadenylyl-sulfate reductase [Opitutus sp.]